MDSGDAIQLVCLIILLCLSALFSSMETALLTCNRIKMRSKAEEGDKRAIRLLKVLDQQQKMLSAILIGNNVVNLSASSIASVLAINIWGNYGAGIATGILTFLILIFGEISPKTYATLKADSMALSVAGCVHVFMVVLTPIIIVINALSRGFLRLLRVDPDAKAAAMTEDELRVIVDVSHEEGVIEKEESKMIKNVVDFGDSSARDVMIPRIDMTFVQADVTYDELIDIFRNDMFTRMPVYEESTDDVIGVVNMKDILLHRFGEDFSVRNYLREPFFTYELKKTSELFVEMRTARTNIAIVLDEYGATAGMITLEDLIEEIVGEIRDEYDADEEDMVKKISDNEYEIEGSVKIDDLNDLLELGISSEEYDSLGGFLIEQLNHLPEVGENVHYKNLVFTVERVDKNRVDMVRVIILSNEKENEESEENN